MKSNQEEKSKCCGAKVRMEQINDFYGIAKLCAECGKPFTPQSPSQTREESGCVEIDKPYPKYCAKHLKEHISIPEKESVDEKWKEQLMDEFCVMFERATREVEPVDWVERMEDFISSALSEQKENTKREIDKLRKRIVSREHYPQITENKIKEREIYNQALDDIINNI